MKITRENLSTYLDGSLAYSASDKWRKSKLLSKGISCYFQACAFGYSHLPLFLVFDLRMLTEFGNSFAFSDEFKAHRSSEAVLAYENHILNRLLQERCVQDLLEMLEFFQAKELTHGKNGFDARADRATFLLIRALGDFWPQEYRVNPAFLRSVRANHLTTRLVGSALERWEQTEGVVPWSDLLSEFVSLATGETVSENPLNWSTMVRPEDMFELENLEVLDREYLRMQTRNLIRARETIPTLDPHDMDLSNEASEAESNFVDETYLPTGGFTQISNRGRFESLVPSELAYMGEGTEDIDLFDLRFVEGELTFFMRDSGQLLRKRRAIHFVIDLRDPLDMKYPGHKFQLSTEALGTLLALVRDLSQLFQGDAVEYSVHFLTGKNPSKGVLEQAEKHKDVLGLLLAFLTRKGLLEMDLIEEPNFKSYASVRRKSYVLAFTSRSSVADSWATSLEPMRKMAPPLFNCVVNLSKATAQNPHVFSHDLDLGRTERDILFSIMVPTKPPVAKPDVDEEDENGFSLETLGKTLGKTLDPDKAQSKTWGQKGRRKGKKRRSKKR